MDNTDYGCDPEFTMEQWKEYVAYTLSDNALWEEELRMEEKSLYENGYITQSELYFGIETDETGE